MNVNACGLHNLGNTCFLNACLQVLSRTEEIYIALLRSRAKAGGSGDFFAEYMDLVAAMGRIGDAVAPARFLHFLRGRGLLPTGGAQGDFSETLLMLIDNLHASVGRPNPVPSTSTSTSPSPGGEEAVTAAEMAQQAQSQYFDLWKYSEFALVLQGVAMSETSAVGGGGKVCRTPEIFSLLNLAIPPSPRNTGLGLGLGLRIEDCFDLYVSPEQLGGENAAAAAAVIKRVRFWSFPPILCVCLMRFSPCGRSKKTDEIAFGCELDLASYYCETRAQEECVYELYAVCNHYGIGLDNGHYVLIVKDDYFHPDPESASWTAFDDNHVYRLVESEVLKQTTHVYCLFYRKRSSK